MGVRETRDRRIAEDQAIIDSYGLEVGDEVFAAQSTTWIGKDQHGVEIREVKYMGPGQAFEVIGFTGGLVNYPIVAKDDYTSSKEAILHPDDIVCKL